MGKIAFVFPGQGTQYTGMGREMSLLSPSALAVFDRLDSVRAGTSDMCFSAGLDVLTQTANTQPSVFACEMAIAAAFNENGIKADMTAGFSLGEIAALTYSGAVSLEDGFKIVCRRGELMQSDAEGSDTAMIAVLKLSDEQVEELCAKYNAVYPVNYNCPGQVSVAGIKSELELLRADVKSAGGRAVPLKVSAGFHSPFMNNAAERFGRFLKDYDIRKPQIPLYSDLTALPYDGDYIELLEKQICSPVRFRNIIENMAASGVDTFVECGPGKVLCGLISKTIPGAKVMNAEDKATFEAALEILKND